MIGIARSSYKLARGLYLIGFTDEEAEGKELVTRGAIELAFKLPYAMITLGIPEPGGDAAIEALVDSCLDLTDERAV
jgi:hypothetical protein